jgi:hypothetical protein
VELKWENKQYEKVEVAYNSQTFALQEIVYYHKYTGEGTGQKIVITYSQITFNKTIPAADFSETKYILKEKLKPIGKWSTYKIIDQTKNI